MPVLRLWISRNRVPDTLVTSSPSISNSPNDGSLSRLIIRSTVDFPEPERPMIAKVSPRSMLKFTSCAPR